MLCTLCNATDHTRRICPARARSGKRKAPRVKPPRRIQSFDCETTSAGIVLFLASDSARHVSRIYDAAGLPLEVVLDWIIDAGAGALNFGFYFDYDCNQIIAMLPHPHQGQLAARGRIRYRRYVIRHVPGKRFSVSDLKRGKSVTVWDCSGWAQMSFARLCAEWQLGTLAERELITTMKARRGTFETTSEAELTEYTTLECSLLSEWVERILALHTLTNIKLRAYSGPGSTASAMMRARGWKPPALPAEVERVAEVAFFGGRSEISCIGPVAGPVHSYDVNSAYPTAISQLPELAQARWYSVRRHIPGAWGFYRVRWRQPETDCWGLFPMRGAELPSGRRSISLLYPQVGSGWFHSWEVEAAMRARPGCVEITGGLIVEPRGAPFDWIGEVAAQRLAFKAAKDARAFPLKVGLNSIYGKLAQHSGTHPLQCLAYAAAVTAHTRAQLTSHALAHGHAVCLLATDGILSTKPLAVTIGAGLGEWEHTTYPDAWLLQAGVYWCGEKKRTRGIDARGLSREQAAAAWQTKRTAASITLESRRVLSYRLCAAQRKQELTGKWVTGTREVRFTPAPRRRPWRWRSGRLLTLPAPVAEYMFNAALDTISLEADAASGYDDLEAMPDWCRE